MFDIKFCENRSRPSNFRRFRIFLFFSSWYHILKFRCIHEASSVGKPKSSNILSQRKNFVKSAKLEIGIPIHLLFFYFFITYRVFKKKVLLFIIYDRMCWDIEQTFGIRTEIPQVYPNENSYSLLTLTNPLTNPNKPKQKAGWIFCSVLKNWNSI